MSVKDGAVDSLRIDKPAEPKVGFDADIRSWQEPTPEPAQELRLYASCGANESRQRERVGL